MQRQNVISIEGGDAAEDRLFDSPERGVFRNNNLLTEITPEAYAEVEAKIEVVRCAPREVIFAEDDPGDCLFAADRRDHRRADRDFRSPRA